MEIKKLIAHIPARAGSKRVKSKNLRMLCGKPMIAYAMECAKSCPEIDEIYVNTDCPIIGALAKEYGVKVFGAILHWLLILQLGTILLSISLSD